MVTVSYVGNLPPTLSQQLAQACDDAVEASLSSYLCFPSDWGDPKYGGAYHRAVAQIRNPLSMGGLGITRARSLVHSSFLASFSASLSWLARSSLRQYLTHDPLGVFTGSQSHFLLQGFTQCRQELIACACVASETPAGLIPENAVVLPSLQELYSPDLSLDPPRVPPQRVLSQQVRDMCPLWLYSNATRGGTAYDLSRVNHLSRSKIKADGGAGSVLSQGTKGDKTELSQSPLSWLLPVAGSPRYDRFPHQLFVIYISMVLGVPVPSLPHDPVQCKCGAPFDSHGHHRMTCKQWHRHVPVQGHNEMLDNLVDAARSIGTGCTIQPRINPSLLCRRRIVRLRRQSSRYVK